MSFDNFFEEVKEESVANMLLKKELSKIWITLHQ